MKMRVLLCAAMAVTSIPGIVTAEEKSYFCDEKTVLRGAGFYDLPYSALGTQQIDRPTILCVYGPTLRLSVFDRYRDVMEFAIYPDPVKADLRDWVDLFGSEDVEKYLAVVDPETELYALVRSYQEIKSPITQWDIRSRTPVSIDKIEWPMSKQMLSEQVSLSEQVGSSAQRWFRTAPDNLTFRMKALR